MCSEWVGLGNATAEDVLRETELRLHTSIRQQSRSVLDCVASFECLAEVAAEVAKRLGSADTLPPTVRMEKVAKANLALLEGARVEAKQNENASWQVRRPARFALLREHVAVALAHEQTPLGEDDEVAEAGRRLAERPPPSPPPLTPIQEMMKVATNETCRQLALKNSTGAHDSHIQATHLWMVRSLLDAAPTARAHAHTHTRTQPIPNRLPAVHGRRRQRRARPGAGLCRLRRAQRPHSNLIPTRSQSESSACCAQFPQFTTSCRQHMAHVGRALVKLRLDAEKPREVPYAEKKRRMVEHVKSRTWTRCAAPSCPTARRSAPPSTASSTSSAR